MKKRGILILLTVIGLILFVISRIVPSLILIRYLGLFLILPSLIVILANQYIIRQRRDPYRFLLQMSLIALIVISWFGNLW